jgi:thiol-disulfide isomerase/thioredoxin
MRQLVFVPAALLLVCAAVAVSQPTPPKPDSDGLGLLTRVARHYADAKSYRIELTEERTTTTEYSRQWNKTVLVGAEAPGNRYYFEGHGEMGTAIRVSDGATLWKYRAAQHRYTAKPASMPSDKKPEPIAMSEMAAMDAGNMRRNLAGYAEHFKSAERLPDAETGGPGKPIMCEVVRVRTSDQKRVNPQDDFERTIWIDREHEIVVKIVEHAHTFMFGGGGRTPIEQETTTTYTHTALDIPLPDSQFRFVPPPDARLIQDFPSPMEEAWGDSTVGDPIPALKFKSADGNVTAIESFRGKPVLIDFWATWCAPCVASMPKLAEIYKEGKDKGLVLLSIDQDEEASKATDFLAKKGYTWPNFHDGDGQIQEQMGSSPIPRMVLVDAKGTVVYDSSGTDENGLRAHIAQLGPEFKDLAPKPAQTVPCVASK